MKYKDDVTIEKNKAWLVTKRITQTYGVDRHKMFALVAMKIQTYGVDYHKMFALVAKMNTIRIIMSAKVNLDWELQ